MNESRGSRFLLALPPIPLERMTGLSLYLHQHGNGALVSAPEVRKNREHIVRLKTLS